MEIKRVPISEVEVWDKNPRNIKTKDMERLKRQLVRFSEIVRNPSLAKNDLEMKMAVVEAFRPLIVYQENGKYITLGGNMRLRALRDLGALDVDVSVVYPRTEAEKIEIALADNDRAGEYDEQALAELAFPYIEDINLEDYKIDTGKTISLKTIIENHGPDIDQKENTKKGKTTFIVICPNCGHEFETGRSRNG